MERDPWWHHVVGPFPEYYGCTGVKDDGGGCMAGRGWVGPMRVHRAVNNHDSEAILAALDAGDDINEVEAAGNTPLHFAAFQGWEEGVRMLLHMGAKIDASNNAGQRALHVARNMSHGGVIEILQGNSASTEFGRVIVPEHIDKVKDFYQQDPDHPLPSQEFMEWAREEDERVAEMQNVPLQFSNP